MSASLASTTSIDRRAASEQVQSCFASLKMPFSDISDLLALDGQGIAGRKLREDRERLNTANLDAHLLSLSLPCLPCVEALRNDLPQQNQGQSFLQRALFKLGFNEGGSQDHRSVIRELV